MNEELRWKNGKLKAYEYGPWLRAGSPKRRAEPSREGYNGDASFQDDDGSFGPVPETRPTGFRPARGTNMDSNGQHSRKETQCAKGGISLNSAKFTGAVSGEFPDGELGNLMQDQLAMVNEGDQGDLRSVSVTSKFGPDVGHGGENSGGDAISGEQLGEGVKEFPVNLGSKVQNATLAQNHVGVISAPMMELFGPQAHVGNEEPIVRDGPISTIGGSLRSWKKRARNKIDGNAERRGTMLSLGKRPAEADGSSEKKKIERKKGKMVVENERGADDLLAEVGA